MSPIVTLSSTACEIKFWVIWWKKYNIYDVMIANNIVVDHLRVYGDGAFVILYKVIELEAKNKQYCGVLTGVNKYVW